MISSRSFFSRNVALLIAVLIGYSGCATTDSGQLPQAPAFCIAVLPVANLSGTTSPVKELQQALISGLQKKGIVVLDDETLQKFMERHHLRSVAGIDSETGPAFKTETGADAVMITTLEFYSVRYPPKASITARLVSTGNEQRILWIDGRGTAGDDSRGILGLGLVPEPLRLLEKSAGSLVDSLYDTLNGNRQAAGPGGRRFQPKSAYRSPIFSADVRYRVAVVPFFDRSERRNAGDIMSLQFVRAMTGARNFEVLEPGVVREKLLAHRTILEQGLSLANADKLFEVLQADLILTGTVFDYEDYQGTHGKPRVSFSVQVIERASREIVWSSRSHNEGDDGVFFYDAGRINTAQAMTARMARVVVEQMVN